MQVIRCELCGSNELIKEDGVFKCTFCGTKYSLEEAKKLFVSGSVSVEGNVSTKDADFIIKSGRLEKYNGESPDVVIPDTVKIIGAECFKDLPIESVSIPESVTEIEYEAFCGCRSLASINIPESVTVIGNRAFADCESLTSFIIPQSVKRIGYYVFDNCSNLKRFTIRASDFTCERVGELQEDKCHGQLTIMGTCDSLETLKLSNNVIIDETIESKIIILSSWKEFSVDIDNPNYSVAEGILFSKDKTKLLYYPRGKENTSFIVPNIVTCIGDFAFWKCDNLISVTIPESVLEIGEKAFLHSKELRTVTILGKTVLKMMAFCLCEKLESLSIPEGSEVYYEMIYTDLLGDYYYNSFSQCTSLDPSQMHVPIFKDPVFADCDFPERGYCEYCAGTLKKGLFGRKCTRCGARYN